MVIAFIQPAATELTEFISPLSAYCITAFAPAPSNHIAWVLPGNSHLPLMRQHKLYFQPAPAYRLHRKDYHYRREHQHHALWLFPSGAIHCLPAGYSQLKPFALKRYNKTQQKPNM
ncbi:hypothetical protein AW211_RS26000, partial [Escherichia coli]